MIFKVSGLTFSYPGSSSAVLKDVSFEVPAGAKVAILGRSGAGKSTLMYLLSLLWEGAYSKGTIYYTPEEKDGALDYRSLPSGRVRNQLRLREFGFVFQSSYLMFHLTCGENIALPLVLQGWPKRYWRPQVERLLRMVEHQGKELTGLADRVGRLSGGQQRRIALLRAISHNPRVLFADEPFSNLDLNSTRLVMELLDQWHGGVLHSEEPRKGRTLFLVTHNLEEAWDICEYFLVLSPSGRLTGGKIHSKKEMRQELLDQWIRGDEPKL